MGIGCTNTEVSVMEGMGEGGRTYILLPLLEL